LEGGAYFMIFVPAAVVESTDSGIRAAVVAERAG